jgi:predicted MPP superfamily phosphohydrolase
MPITRRAFLRTGVAGGIGLAAVGTYGVAYEPHRVGLTHATVTLPDLPHALDGVRIGVLTDLHHSLLVSQQHILDAVHLLMTERPDLIVLLGDYASWADRAYVGGCIEALAPLSAPCGVFAILGNHDDERIMPRALAARGFDVLLDARTDVRIRGEAVGIAGIRFWPKKASDLRRVLAGSPRPAILLSHDPRRLTEAAALGVPLVLAGHTHGGQVVLPLVGALAARKYPIAQGLMTQDRTTLFVSRGVGTVLVPIRLNCPPEAAVVTLRFLSSQ